MSYCVTVQLICGKTFVAALLLLSAQLDKTFAHPARASNSENANVRSSALRSDYEFTTKPKSDRYAPQLELKIITEAESNVVNHNRISITRYDLSELLTRRELDRLTSSRKSGNDYSNAKAARSNLIPKPIPLPQTQIVNRDNNRSKIQKQWETGTEQKSDQQRVDPNLQNHRLYPTITFDNFLSHRNRKNKFGNWSANQYFERIPVNRFLKLDELQTQNYGQDLNLEAYPALYNYAYYAPPPSYKYKPHNHVSINEVDTSWKWTPRSTNLLLGALAVASTALTFILPPLFSRIAGVSNLNMGKNYKYRKYFDEGFGTDIWADEVGGFYYDLIERTPAD